MEFAILTKEWLQNKGVVIRPEWRHNIYGTEFILHKEKVEPLLNATDSVTFYNYDDSEFVNIIHSDEWVLDKRRDNTSNL